MNSCIKSVIIKLNRNSESPNANTMNSRTPIACDLSAIDEANIEDHRANSEEVFKAINEVREIADGYKFKLPADTGVIKHAGAFVARERLCCPFFEFKLKVQPDHKPVWLILTGREGVKAYMEEALLPQLDAPITTLN